jgi:hypothetical protein
MLSQTETVGAISETNIFALNTEDGPTRTQTRLFVSHVNNV